MIGELGDKTHPSLQPFATERHLCVKSVCVRACVCKCTGHSSRTGEGRRDGEPKVSCHLVHRHGGKRVAEYGCLPRTNRVCRHKERGNSPGQQHTEAPIQSNTPVPTLGGTMLTCKPGCERRNPWLKLEAGKQSKELGGAPGSDPRSNGSHRQATQAGHAQATHASCS